MSENGVISDDLAVATVNIEESECLKNKRNSFSNLTFCCVCCFRRRNETNSIQRREKKKRNKRNEEENHTSAMLLDKPDKEDQQRKGQDHWSIVSLGEHDHGDAVTLAAKPCSIEIQDNLSAVLLDVHYNEEKQEQKHLSAMSPNAHCKEQQRKDRQNYLNNLSLDAQYERGKQGGQDDVSAVCEEAPTNEEQLCQGVPYKEKQPPMGPEHLSILSLGVTYEKEKQERQDHVSSEFEGTAYKEEQDSQGVPYKEEQQRMGPERPNNLSLGGIYEQEKQGQDHVSTESEGAAYKEEQDCRGVPYQEQQQPIRPELLSTLFLDITYEKEQQVGKDHESTVSEGASCKKKQYNQGAPYSKQQTMGPEQLSTLSLSGISEEEQHVRKDHLNSRSLGALYETDKQLGQDHQSNLFLFVPYDAGKQLEGQDHQNTMLLSVPWDSERELWEGQDPQKIISLYVPREEEEQKEKQDLLNTMILCVPCDKEKHQEDQNLLCTVCEKEMKQQDGQQDHLSPISLCVTCEEDEKEEEEQDLLNSTFLYEP